MQPGWRGRFAVFVGVLAASVRLSSCRTAEAYVDGPGRVLRWAGQDVELTVYPLPGRASLTHQVTHRRPRNRHRWACGLQMHGCLQMHSYLQMYGCLQMRGRRRILDSRPALDCRPNPDHHRPRCHPRIEWPDRAMARRRVHARSLNLLLVNESKVIQVELPPRRHVENNLERALVPG